MVFWEIHFLLHFYYQEIPNNAMYGLLCLQQFGYFISLVTVVGNISLMTGHYQKKLQARPRIDLDQGFWDCVCALSTAIKRSEITYYFWLQL